MIPVPCVLEHGINDMNGGEDIRDCMYTRELDAWTDEGIKNNKDLTMSVIQVINSSG